MTWYLALREYFYFMYQGGQLEQSLYLFPTVTQYPERPLGLMGVLLDYKFGVMNKEPDNTWQKHQYPK